ncbi:phage tail tape measure protein [Maridesulfovibrio ferrireducens]|uniref:phage tail tape measure protein n=1 Tax=Maridesulfovibrio ferrireducens TaxID=246191 RepID=UPI001A352CA7|nr:phage tail tape measure protein [Maridesulfovibrio ferrireducens]MBI9109911.1 phage tail tape measure protein [Maridesulfovibrio ferrireducens]
MSKLEKLTFSIDVLASKAMGTVGKVQQSLDTLANKASSAFRNIGMGGAGVLGAGFAIKSMIQPALDFNNAMRDVSSLSVQADAMDALANKSLLYSVKYGEGAAEFVSSSYDIQSAIGGLSGNDLASFTNASNVLAKGTKADAGTITNYMGTMYGIFKKDAEAMGKSKWVEQMSGKTATAVEMFKTTGTQMSEAFSSVGAAGQAAGISASEQFAVLGTLQATMSGSEAGTKYKAFLDGVGAAQKKLGLSFTDSEGKMLPMLDIMQKMKSKFGDTLDVAESDSLKSAFGSAEAVAMIKLLINDTDNLSASIGKLEKVSGMAKAESMAMKRVDPYQRMIQGANAAQIVIGRLLTPAIDKLFNFVADVTKGIVDWANAYPELAKWVGYAGVGLLAFTGILGVLSIVAGFGKITMLAWSGAVSMWTTVTKGAALATTIWSKATTLLNMAWKASPFGMVLAGITLLIAAIPVITKLWDSFKNAFGDTWWGKALIGALDPVMDWLKSLGKAVGWVLEKLGLSFDVSATSKVEKVVQASETVSASKVAPVQSLQQMKQSAVASGGIKQDLVNISNKSNSQTQNNGPVTHNHYGPHSNTNEQFALGLGG